MFLVKIFQPIVPYYRIGLFEGVGRRYAHRVSVVAPKRSGGFESYYVDGVECDFNHAAYEIGPIVFVSNLTLKGLRRGDVIVINGDVRYIMFMVLALIAKVRGIGVVWWGLHKMPNQKRLNLAIRTFIMKHLATSILFYNKSGIEWMKRRENNVSHVFAVGNAIDLVPIKKELEYWTELRLTEFQHKMGIMKKRMVLVCSQLGTKLRLHEALQALAQPNMPEDILLAVIGDGPLAKDLKQSAVDLNVSDRVMWLGKKIEQHELAPWFLSAKIFVYPGPVGLGVLHAMAYGLPAVLNDTHNSTEAEAFENGRTGMMFKEFDAKDLAKTICHLLSDEKLRLKMGVYARQRVMSQYTMESMVDNFCRAVDDAAKQVGR